MLNNISWASYFYALTILLTVYYAVILVLFYRSEVLQLLIHKRLFLLVKFKAFANRIEDARMGGNQSKMLQENSESTTFESRAEVHNTQIEQAALDEVKAYITQAAQYNTIKEELLFSLQNILKKYPMQGNTPLQHTLNNLIALECANKCSIHLSEDEVSGLWRG